MSWLSRKNKKDLSTTDTERKERDVLDIEVHKNASKEAINEAKQATQKLNTLLVENGFTLKIYLATGGKQRNQKERH